MLIIFQKVFKDNDLKYKIVVRPKKKFCIGNQLRMDSAFLARHEVMDYSLLLGVHRSQFLRTRLSQWPVPVTRMPEPVNMIELNNDMHVLMEELESQRSHLATDTAADMFQYGTSNSSKRSLLDTANEDMPFLSHRSSLATVETSDLDANIGVLDGRAGAQLMEGPNK